MINPEIKITEQGQEENFTSSFLLDRYQSKIMWNAPSPHKHNCHELYFLLDGITQYCIGDDIYNIKAGDVVLVPQGMFHRTLHKLDKSYDRFLIYFSDEFAAPFFEQVGRNEYNKLLQLRSIRLSPANIEQLIKLFEKLNKENLQKDAYSEISMVSIFCEILVLLMRFGGTIQKINNKSENSILEAVHYINNHYNQEISLNSISQLSYMSPTYFSQCFKKVMGVTFQEYLLQSRLKIAEEFLATSSLSIRQIAENCGFLGSNYFGDVFKKYKGLSPSAYRKKMQGKYPSSK